MTTLAKWRSHKVVMAGKILGFKGDGDGAFDTLSVEGLYGPVDIKATDGLFWRGRPSVGDYIFIDDDGRQNWIRADLFTADHRRIEEAG